MEGDDGPFAYELQRNAKIQENARTMASLRLSGAKGEMRTAVNNDAAQRGAGTPAAQELPGQEQVRLEVHACVQDGRVPPKPCTTRLVYSTTHFRNDAYRIVKRTEVAVCVRGCLSLWYL